MDNIMHIMKTMNPKYCDCTIGSAGASVFDFDKLI